MWYFLSVAFLFVEVKLCNQGNGRKCVEYMLLCHMKCKCQNNYLAMIVMIELIWTCALISDPLLRYENALPLFCISNAAEIKTCLFLLQSTSFCCV